MESRAWVCFGRWPDPRHQTHSTTHEHRHHGVGLEDVSWTAVCCVSSIERREDTWHACGRLCHAARELRCNRLPFSWIVRCTRYLRETPNLEIDAECLCMLEKDRMIDLCTRRPSVCALVARFRRPRILSGVSQMKKAVQVISSSILRLEPDRESFSRRIESSCGTP